LAEASVVADFLVRSLQQVDPRPLKGSELSVLAKTAYPDFIPDAFGCRTLREFIRRYASEIMEFSRAGMDISYHLKVTHERLKAEGASSEFNCALDQLTRNPRIWKTFASPESLFRIYLDPATGLLRTLHNNSRPLPEWREIPKVSAEVLLQIGRDFTADLPDLQKSVLSPLLQDPKWWIPYYERLQSLGLKTKWIEFRRRRIRDEFQRQLGESKTTPLSAQPILASTSAVETTTSATKSELSIRRIAADVVQRMTESELRGLNLPLGYVVDSLTTR
jgi:hypothetical protein